MNSIFSEKDYQHYILNRLQKDNDFVIRDARYFDRMTATDPEMLLKFLQDTQPETMADLQKIYKADTEETIRNYINSEVTKANGSLVETLKHGVDMANHHLDLMYTKPATTFNKELVEKYDHNIFSAMEEVQASDSERIDLVIFLNGFAIMSFELKCNIARQSYHDAILQYSTARDPKTRLFLWKAGCIVNFAMDLDNVYMTTKLAGKATFFRPFNQGSGEGVNAGAGNPVYKDRISVDYMWTDILTKDTILDLISKFIYIERKDEKDQTTGKILHKEQVIFPRYHQLDLIRKLLADVKEHGSSQNYLIQHSAGSGKTNSIAWLTYRLTSLHDDNNKVIFDTVIVVTDRVVVDRQLHQALLSMDHHAGQITVMDDKCTSKDLAYALEHRTKIIATTIQKFPYIIENVANLNNLRFAVIIDEAHSSTSGKDMKAVTDALGAANTEPKDAQDMIDDAMAKNGKPANMSVFAFTATPKPTTLRMFGRLNKNGQYQAFHLYSMKQAIEEGYILDVLQNYTTYHTLYQINKEIQDDPMMKTSSAKRQIARFVELHDTNITQRVEVIIEHFRQNVMNMLGGQAKAMVITASRAGAVKYRKAFEEYINRKGYSNIHALVAFSGKVKLDGDDTEYSEAAMNNMPEAALPDAFDTDNYNVLLVANKYQTGFDQPKLCAMYIMKKLSGVNAVQTLSRPNRICPPYDKQVFVLDFVNDYEDIQKAFAPYYTTTLLANDLTPTKIYDLEAKIDAYGIIDPLQVDNVFNLVFKKRSRTITVKEQQSLVASLTYAANKIAGLGTEEKQKEFVMLLRHFKRFYEYMTQVSCLKDDDLYKKYVYIDYLYSYINISGSGAGFDLTGKIRADNFVQEKTGTYVKEKLTADPITHIAQAAGFGGSEEKTERLSEIIKEINSRTGKKLDDDVTVKALLQIRDLLLKSQALKTSAQNNSEKDFSFSYYDGIDDALVEGFAQNQEFFTLLLNNEDIKKQVLGLFEDEVYRKLRSSGKTAAY